MAQGFVVVLSGPSGVGKGTVNAELIRRRPEVVPSVSLTTREKRPGEIEGVNYFYTDRDEFIARRDAGGLLEWAEYVGNYYGTPRSFVEEKVNEGCIVLLEIETQGALKLRDTLQEGVFIFLAPPHFDRLAERIDRRGMNTPEQLERRVQKAREEMKSITAYDYIVVNEVVEEAVRDIEAILKAEERRIARNRKLIEELCRA